MTEIPRDRCCSVTDCDRPLIARGLCTKHYQRWRNRNRDKLNESDRGIPAIDRLLRRIVFTDSGCWEYQGALCIGYARLRGDDGRKVFGHRLAWEHLVGAIPKDLTYDHLCENRRCVNPEHGELVPLLVNIRRATRGTAAANRVKTHCPKGHSYTGDNLKVDAKGGRWCRACTNANNRAYRRRQKEGVR